MIRKLSTLVKKCTSFKALFVYAFQIGTGHKDKILISMYLPQSQN